MQRDAQTAGDIAGGARKQIEAETGRLVVSSENANTLTARAQQPQLFAAEDSAEDERDTLSE